MLWLGILAVVVGISLNYLFLPIRAAQFPAINEGEPVTWKALLDVLNRAQYGKPPVTERQADFLSQLGNYWQYWGWQFARDWERRRPAWPRRSSPTLGLVGLWALIRREARAGVAALACCYPDARPDLLPQLQVRVLAAPRPAGPPPRGP